MIGSPCGHRTATCVVGNFWLCPTCDRAAAPAEEIEPERTACLHGRVSHADVQKWICADCGEIFATPGAPLACVHDWTIDTGDPTGLWTWRCKVCGHTVTM